MPWGKKWSTEQFLVVLRTNLTHVFTHLCSRPSNYSCIRLFTPIGFLETKVHSQAVFLAVSILAKCRFELFTYLFLFFEPNFYSLVCVFVTYYNHTASLVWFSSNNI